MKTLYIDSETLGLYGPAAIIQYAFDEDKPQMYNPWLMPVGKTLDLFEEFMECRVVAHNLTFDHQKIQSMYNALYALDRSVAPIDHLEEMVELFYTERSKLCLKPPKAVCTLLICQKELGGTSLAAKEIRIRQIPRVCADELCNLMNTYTDLPPIVFAKRRDAGWHVGESDKGPEWADVMLKFAPSNGLKEVCKLVLGVKDTQKIGAEVLPPVMPFEVGYCPYAHLIRESGIVPPDEKLWPELLRDHITFWNTNEAAVKYALDDITLLRQLHKHLGSRDTDFDSELAVQVASCRQAGFTIDVDQLQQSMAGSQKVVETAEINVDAHRQVRGWIAEALDPMEQHIVSEGCDKKTLKKLVANFVATEREECDCDGGCPRCGGAGVIEPGLMPVAKRAQHILDVRKHKKRLQLYTKLAVARGAFPSFRVIGTKSGRMSGADGLNYHGIDGSKDIRSIFVLAEDGEIVSGGDMNSQELAIAAAVMHDDNLARDIETGRSLHGEFASAILEVPYEQIIERKEDKATPEGQAYAKAKICVYAMLYGAAAFNVSITLGCTVAEAEAKIEAFFAKYPYMKNTRELVKNSLRCLTSSEGGRIEVCEPQQTFIDSCFGFRRSFEIEMKVMQAVVSTMDHVKSMFADGGPLSMWTDAKIIRREDKGTQTYMGCILSALYGAAFSLQGKIQRAALNHLIQSAGRTCTLRVQKRIWDLQPGGIHPFVVKLMSVHDEVVTVSKPDRVKDIEQAVFEEMHDLTKTVPLLSLDWSSDVGSWYGVKSATDGLRCGWSEDDEEDFEEMLEAEGSSAPDIIFD